MRLLPPLPSTSSAAAVVAEHDGGRHHRRHPHAGRRGVEAAGVQVVLAEHVVEQDAGARDDVAGALAVRRRHRGDAALAVGTLTWVVPRAVDGAGRPAGQLARPAPVDLDHVLDQAVAHAGAVPVLGASARCSSSGERRRGGRRRTAAGW